MRNCCCRAAERLSLIAVAVLNCLVHCITETMIPYLSKGNVDEDLSMAHGNKGFAHIQF